MKPPPPIRAWACVYDDTWPWNMDGRYPIFKSQRLARSFIGSGLRVIVPVKITPIPRRAGKRKGTK